MDSKAADSKPADPQQGSQQAADPTPADPQPADSQPANAAPPTAEPSDPTPTFPSLSPSPSKASITHLPNASIFAAPPNTLLLHACNARGSWGAGVAAAFKAHYPRAFGAYNKHCLHPSPPSKPGKEWQKSLVGTCLLIPPQKNSEEGEGEGEKGHWVGCLFTSWGYGRQVDGVEKIVESTERAVKDLRRQLQEEKEGGGKGVERVWSVRINSGMFGVEWERTEEVLREGGVDMVIVTPAEGEGTGKKRKGKGGERGEVKKAKKGKVADDDGGTAEDGEAAGKKDALRKSGRKRGQGGLDGWLK